jgi:hypothetical protein
MKVQDLTGTLLDYWVARAWIEKGGAPFTEVRHNCHPGLGPLVSCPSGPVGARYWTAYAPSKCWSDCGPLIEAGKIELVWEKDGTVWACNNEGSGGDHDPRVAICRAWVKSVYGEEVPPFARGGK